MKEKKSNTRYSAIVVMMSLILSIVPVVAGAGEFHAVKGALYINDTAAPAGVMIYLVFQTENLSRPTFEWDDGYNYAMSFQGHEGETGSFLVYYGGYCIVPLDNTTVTIQTGIIKYHVDLHISSEIPVDQAPYMPSSPTPSNGATNVFLNDVLSWVGGDPDIGDTVTYDVYFGTSNPPSKVIAGQSSTSYSPALMNYQTTYYWKIIAWDNHGMMTAGPVWHFTTVPVGTNNPPNIPTNPSAADSATGIAVTSQLSWTGGDPDPGDSATYDVYFGTTSSPPKITSNLSATSYNVGTMSYSTRYYWKIIAWDTQGYSRAGPLWSFTTRASDGGGGGGGGGGGNERPIANASKGEPYTAFMFEIITFDGSYSYDPDGSIVSYAWNFGDGHQGTGKTSLHSYTSAGTYTVTLTVTDDEGATGVDTTTANILPSANLPPSKPTIAGLPVGNKNVLYDYTATSTDPDNDTIKYTFTWGDESDPIESELLASGTPYTARHQWTTAGKYTLMVTATDNQNASDFATLTVYIDAIDIDSIGYLTDDNGDGIWDTFHNSTSGINTTVEQVADGNYLIDTNGDGAWDLIYDPLTKTSKKYTGTPSEGTTDNNALMILGGLLGLALILFLAILLIGKKKKDPGPSQPAPPVAKTPPPAKKTKSTKKTGKK